MVTGPSSLTLHNNVNGENFGLTISSTNSRKLIPTVFFGGNAILQNLTLSYANLESLSSNTEISLLNSINPLTFDITGGMILSFSKLNFFGGTIFYQNLHSQLEVIQPAQISNKRNSITEINLHNQPITFNIESRNSDYDLLIKNGEFTNGNNLTKDGAGSLFIAGKGNFKDISVNNGKLYLGEKGDQFSAQNIRINTNAFLGGLGTLVIPVSVNEGGTIQPGLHSQLGQLTLQGSLVNEAGGIIKTRATNLTTFDQLKVNGAVIIRPNSTIIFEGQSTLTPGNYDIIDNSGDPNQNPISIAEPINIQFILPDNLIGILDYTSNPHKVTVIIRERRNEPTCGEIDPPANLEIDVINKKSNCAKVRLSWTESPCDSILGYFIYRNEKHIGTVKPDELEFVDNIHRNKCYLYEVTAVKESDPIAGEIRIK